LKTGKTAFLFLFVVVYSCGHRIVSGQTNFILQEGERYLCYINIETCKGFELEF